MLKIHGLKKKFKNFQALDGLDMEIEEGALYGFVGPNGAGKTTAIRIITGLLLPDEGTVEISGKDVIRYREEVKDYFGYVPDEFGMYDNLKVWEYMEFFASCYGFTGLVARNRCQELLEQMKLADKEDAFVDSLSRGMKQRLCVARALIHNPDLLVLDEPNSGLDPRARFEMKEVLKNLSSMGKTIIISSHILPELSEMCTSIGIMEHGRLIVSGRVEDVMQQSMGSSPIHISAYVENMENKEQAQEFIGTVLREQPLVSKVNFTEDEVLVNFKGDEKQVAQLLKFLISKNIMVNNFYREKEDLESLFLQITGGQEDEK